MSGVLTILILIISTAAARKYADLSNYTNCDFTLSSYRKTASLARRSCRPSFSRSRPGRSVDDSCYFEVEAAGLNVSTFHWDVAHGIHFITVEDIKYYFDPSIPNENDIPTVNTNLSGDHVLMSAPFGSEFSTPGMRLMDFILSNDDGNDNFMVRGLSRMEKIAHGMHMLELWHKTGEVYEEIKANPPHDKVCSCVTDEDNNGILAALETISIYMRTFGGEEGVTSNQLEEETSSNQMDGDANNAEPKELPALNDAESWKIWKAMLKESMIDEKGIYHIAMYIYCKMATFAQI